MPVLDESVEYSTVNEGEMRRNLVVSSFVPSLSTHLQIVSADLRSALEDLRT